MNKITKKSFYSFLALYLISSFIFLALAAYWFFTSQVSMEMNNNFYKMTHVADDVSSKIIKAHMMGEKYTLERFPDTSVALYNKGQELLQGGVLKKFDFSNEFYMKDEAFTLVSKRASEHLGVEYVVVQSSQCIHNVAAIKNSVIYTVILTAFFIIIISVFLSYMFLKPLRDKMKEIEDFVKDTTHELNTPITALMMSTSRLKSKKTYDEKINKNISISTKQLYDIYSSLSFLSFDNKSEELQEVVFDDVVGESVEYFGELLEKKRISVIHELAPCSLNIAPTKAKMLINNLLSNSIKYSTPDTTIHITTSSKSFSIKDEGIGINEEKLDGIFKRFVRANSYAGGFGVGLNIVDSIVKEYDYDISIKSKEEVGTTICITF